MASLRPGEVPLSEEDLRQTPPAALALIQNLLEKVQALEAWIEQQEARIKQLEMRNAKLQARNQQLEAQLKVNSSNSNRPPSSDSPFKPKPPKASSGKRGGRPGHQGHRQAMLDPTDEFLVHPGPCRCGSAHFPTLEPYYVHQVIELPEVEMEVTHFHLLRGRCPCCGHMNKARVPDEHRAGYGPRLSAMVAEMAGMHKDSRRLTQDFCASVLGVSISLGAIQKIIDRANLAISPHYDAIAHAARAQAIAHVDETSWRHCGALSWLWVMGSPRTALFMVHKSRSRRALESLFQGWRGILVSDDFGVYRRWQGLRQSCLAHLIRHARGLSERTDASVAGFGRWALAELRRLCKMAHAPPTIGQWRAFHARFSRLISRHADRKDVAGTFARRLQENIDNLWLFLQEQGVEPTNNHAERLLRFAVTWRRASLGSASDKGDRFVERILSLRHTCRLRGIPSFPILVDAIRHLFQRTTPNLAWI